MASALKLSICVMIVFNFSVTTSSNAQSFRIPDDCREVLSTLVEVKLRGDGRDEIQMRSVMRQLASLDAVQKILGTIVRSRAESAISSDQSNAGIEISKSFRQRIKSQSAGLVALNVTEEEYTTERSLLRAEAKLCLPKDLGSLRETVFIGPFSSSRDEDLIEAQKIFSSVFSNSRSFVTVNDKEDCEWVVSGKILSVDVRSLQIIPDSGGNLLLQHGNSALNELQNRIHVKGFVQAQNSSEDKITQNFDEYQNLSVNRDANDFIEMWMPEIMTASARKLVEKIVAYRPGQSSTGPSKSSTPQKPKW